MADTAENGEHVSDEIDIHNISTAQTFYDLSFQDTNEQGNYDFYQIALITAKSTFTRLKNRINPCLPQQTTSITHQHQSLLQLVTHSHPPAETPG